MNNKYDSAKAKICVTGGSGFIGTNLIENLSIKSFKILNIDIRPPKVSFPNSIWIQCDILDKVKLIDLVANFKPNFVIHLAAVTDTNPNLCMNDYLVNTEGTSNLLEAIIQTRSIDKVIITSSQFVHQADHLPSSALEFIPHTIYGKSKVITEQLTRSSNLNCTWTIIRPTNVWGPWHQRYPREFWKVLSEGYYYHPGYKKVVRAYGYVGNVVYQMIKILESQPEIVNQQVFYVGDAPLNLYDWVNGFSLALTGKSVKVVPRSFIQLLAYFGELLQQLNISFPLTLSRYKSMITDNNVPMENTFEKLGIGPFSLTDGIELTLYWIKKYCPDLVQKNRK